MRYRTKQDNQNIHLQQYNPKHLN